MENLSISDPPRQSTPQSGGQLGSAAAAAASSSSGGPPQLPPQMFTTAAQLLDLTDSEVLPPCFAYERNQASLPLDLIPPVFYLSGTSLRK